MPQKLGSSHKVSDQTGRMEIYSPQENGNIFASSEWKYIRLKRMEIYSPQTNGNIFASSERKYIRLKRMEIYSPQANGNIFASSEWKYIRLKRMLCGFRSVGPTLNVCIVIF